MTAPAMHALFDGSDHGLIPDLAAKLDEVLALIESASDGDYLSRLERGTNIAIECAKYLRDHGPALRALLAEHEALLRRVEALAAKWDRIAEEHGVRQFTGNGHKLFANELRVAMRILAEPGEVGL